MACKEKSNVAEGQFCVSFAASVHILKTWWLVLMWYEMQPTHLQQQAAYPTLQEVHEFVATWQHFKHFFSSYMAHIGVPVPQLIVHLLAQFVV